MGLAKMDSLRHMPRLMPAVAPHYQMVRFFHSSRSLAQLKIMQILNDNLGVSPQVAAVATDAVMSAYYGIATRAEVKKEETVFLFGLGGLGFNALQIVRHIGSRVIVSDVRQEKLDAAEKLGVPKEDIVPIGKPVPEFVKESGLLGKIDTVLEFVGKHQTFGDAQQIGKMLNCPIRISCAWLN